jgi:hypothetical protein
MTTEGGVVFLPLQHTAERRGCKRRGDGVETTAPPVFFVGERLWEQAAVDREWGDERWGSGSGAAVGPFEWEGAKVGSVEGEREGTALGEAGHTVGSKEGAIEGRLREGARWS